MDHFLVEFYETANGERPAKEFMESLDHKMRVKMMMTIAVMQEKGNCLREPYSKHLEDGIFEARAKAGSDISRVLYFFCHGNRIILTNGFIKKTQRTPRREINKAKAYRKEYLERVGDS